MKQTAQSESMELRFQKYFACLLAMFLSTAAWASDLPVVGWQGETMGTVYTIKIVDPHLKQEQIDALKTNVELRLREINRQMSHYDPDSELSRFNRAPPNAPFKVSPEFARVVRFSLEVCRRSEGAFDPTLAPVINLWGFGEKTDKRSVPSDAQLKAALKSTGYKHFRVTDHDELIKELPELTLNLSAVAKGFAVDEIARVLGGHALSNVYASIAGEVLVLGHNPRGKKWQIGISAPVAHWRESDPMAAAVSLSNQAISTSGDYQQFFTDAQGRRLSHIIDPKTGWPVQHNVGGVSVVAPSSMIADALGTTLFVLGVDEGLRFIESWTNAAAVFIVREGDGSFRKVPSSKFAALSQSTE